jgi:hypothetical protein
MKLKQKSILRSKTIYAACTYAGSIILSASILIQVSSCILFSEKHTYLYANNNIRSKG